MDEVKKTKARVVREKKDKKPSSPAKRLIRNLLITLVVGAVYFYVALPAINLHNPGFYGFFFLLAVVFCLLTIMSNATIRQESDSKQAWKLIRQTCAVPLVICAALAVIYLGGSLLSSVIVRAGAYSELMTVETGDFSADVAAVHYDSIPMLDKDSAERLGDRKLGELSDMVSQFEVVHNYTQINYLGRPVRVATLRYGDAFKWLGNQSDGLPAYIIIDMVNQQADVVRLSEGMKYSTADHFGRNLMRHLRFSYPTFMFDTPHFEIDEQGHPYWVCPKIEKTIGLFGGTDVNGVVLVDAISGACQYVTDIPAWVDSAYTANLLEQQYNYYGLYKNGFLNSMFGQKNCTVTTEGYNYIAMNDDVYVYTGITSVGGDESNIGFIMANQRTKETTFYPMTAAEEYSAMDSAKGLVQEKNYDATFPLLLNINGQPTYFMSLKDSAGLVKMYAMISVQHYQIGAAAETVRECEELYLRKLADQGVSDVPAEVENIKESRVLDIRTAVIEGETYYYFLLDDQSYHRVRAGDNELAVLINVGDTIQVNDLDGSGATVISRLIGRK